MVRALSHPPSPRLQSGRFVPRSRSYFFAATNFASRLFCRAAAFLWMMLFCPARSSSFTASAYAAWASAAPVAERTLLSAVRNWLR